MLYTNKGQLAANTISNRINGAIFTILEFTAVMGAKGNCSKESVFNPCYSEHFKNGKYFLVAASGNNFNFVGL